MGLCVYEYWLWGQGAINSCENNEQLIEAENWSLKSEALGYVVVKSLPNVALVTWKVKKNAPNQLVSYFTACNKELQGIYKQK